jgi:hypothetical protein
MTDVWHEDSAAVPKQLELLAEELEDEVACEGGEDSNGEVGEGEDVLKGEGEGLAGSGVAVELAHQEVGVEEEDDEGYFDERTPDRG